LRSASKFPTDPQHHNVRDHGLPLGIPIVPVPADSKLKRSGDGPVHANYRSNKIIDPLLVPGQSSAARRYDPLCNQPVKKVEERLVGCLVVEKPCLTTFRHVGDDFHWASKVRVGVPP
jgi:hypothetical protein